MQRLSVIITLVGLWSYSAHAQCPQAVPKPMTAFDIDCFTLGRPPDERCATTIPSHLCLTFNLEAFVEVLVTTDGYHRLFEVGFCAIVLDIGAGPTIYDLCPVGSAGAGQPDDVTSAEEELLAGDRTIEDELADEERSIELRR